MPGRIYLAGPEVFLPPKIRDNVAAAKKRICESHGFEGVFPVEGGADPPPHTPEAGRKISRDNERLMRSCDLLIANMTPFRGPSMDVGTAYEMGFMRSLGRPVLGYSNVGGTLKERSRRVEGVEERSGQLVDQQAMSVEDFELTENLMIDGAVVSSGSGVISQAADAKAIWTDLTGFEKCVAAAVDLRPATARPDRIYFSARRWTLARACSTLRRWRRLWDADRALAFNALGRHLEGLYILRVPLGTLLFLLALPWVALGPMRSLLENLFVGLGFWALTLTTLVAFLTAASAVAVINAILVNGHERFPWLPMGKYYGGPLHWLTVLVPAPLVWVAANRAAIRLVTAWTAVALGGTLGLFVLLWIRVEQSKRSERLNDIFPSWTSRPLTYPHPLPFESGHGAPEGTPARMLQPLWVLWSLARVIQWLRYTIFGLFRLVGRSWVGTGISHVGRWVKQFVPEAGLIYVPESEAERGRPERPFYSAPHYLLLLSTFLFLLWLSFSVGRIGVGLDMGLPTLAYLIFTVWVGCLLVSAVTFMLDRYRVPLLTLMVVWALVGARLAPNDHYYQTHRTQDDLTGLGPGAILDARVPSPAVGGGPVILVAAAGGGIQAAAWTARVLTGLEEELPGVFGPAVAVLSGVSGGSVGIYYFADAYDGGLLLAERLGKAYASSTASSLDEVAWGLAAIDLPRAFLPLPLPRLLAGLDRGWALEQALARRSNDASATLASWEQDVRARRRPAVIFNATLVESGVPILFATTHVPDRPTGRASYDAVDFRALQFDEPGVSPARTDIDLATAVRLSATFPFVTPVATSDQVGPVALSQHVADGGYYDNFGVMSLMSWLDEGLRTARRRPSRILLLQINAFPNSDATRREPVRSSLFQAYAPLTTLTSVRQAAQRLRNEQEFGYLQRYWQALPSGQSVSVRVRAVDFSPSRTYADPDPPLSWQLNAEQLGAITRAWSDAKETLVPEVREFLATTGTQSPGDAR